MKSKWVLFAVAIVIMAFNLLNADFSVFQNLSPADLLPVIIIALVSFLIRSYGIESAANESPGIAVAIPGNLLFIIRFIASSGKNMSAGTGLVSG